MKGAFRSLANRDFRYWSLGSLLSNVGTWVQRIAQDWLVLTQLTHESATALGIVTGLQFAPMIFLVPFSGLAADGIDRKKLLIATQVASAALALALGLLTLADIVTLNQVYIFAFLLGCVNAFDNPARQTFAGEIVDEGDLANAIALNSTSFNVARLIGPAVAGLLLAEVGSGGSFLINAASYVFGIASLCVIKTRKPVGHDKLPRSRGGLAEGFRYIRGRPDLSVVLVMLFLVGTFGLNFPIFLSAMSVSVFDAGAGRYGLLMSFMAIGSIVGAFLTAGNRNPGMTFLMATAGLFGMSLAFAALAPNYWVFAALLMLTGASSVAFTTATSSFMQLATEPVMRGRVIAIRMAVGVGGTPLGAPLTGWVADALGPRWAVAVGALSGLASGFAALWYLVRHRGLHIGRKAGRWSIGSKEDRPCDKDPNIS